MKRLALAAFACALTCAGFAQDKEPIEIAKPVDGAVSATTAGARLVQDRAPKVTNARFSKLFLAHKDGPWVDIAEGIRIQDVHVGTGNSPTPQATVFLRWDMFDSEGWGVEFKEDGHKSSSIQYIYGVADTNLMQAEILDSFEKGVATMREGGRRLIWVRADKAFGAQGSQDPAIAVGPDTDLIFEVSLMWVRITNPKRFTQSEPMSRDISVSEGKGAKTEQQSAVTLP